MADNPVGDKLVADLKDQLTLGPARRAVANKIDAGETAVKNTANRVKNAAVGAYQQAGKYLNDQVDKYETKPAPVKKAQTKRQAYKR